MSTPSSERFDAYLFVNEPDTERTAQALATLKLFTTDLFARGGRTRFVFRKITLNQVMKLHQLAKDNPGTEPKLGVFHEGEPNRVKGLSI